MVPGRNSAGAHAGVGLGVGVGSERRHDDADKLPGAVSAAGRDQTPQGRGAEVAVGGGPAAAARGPEAAGDFWGLGAVWRGSRTEKERSMRCEGNGFPRGSEKVGGHRKLEP